MWTKQAVLDMEWLLGTIEGRIHAGRIHAGRMLRRDLHIFSESGQIMRGIADDINSY